MTSCRLMLLLSLILYVTGWRSEIYQTFLKTLNEDHPPSFDATDNIIQPYRTGDSSGFGYESLAFKYYSGLFHTVEEIRRIELQRIYGQDQVWGRPPISWKRSAPDDFDMCCSTRIARRHDDHRRNTDNQLRAIVHLHNCTPTRYQWYHYAECGSVDNCLGSCRLQNITISLLVFKMGNQTSPNFPFEFDTFPVPGYCSCKSS